MKNIQIKPINIKKLSRKITEEKSSWQRSLIVAAILSFLVFSIASAYLFFKPLNSEVKRIVEEEISSSNIIFDAKTIQGIQKRYQPQTNINNAASKDPFAQF